jgi:hypothetical protein
MMMTKMVVVVVVMIPLFNWKCPTEEIQEIPPSR